MITGIKVTSSNLDTVAYFNGDVFVRFKWGGAYQYKGVPLAKFVAMLEAESVGTQFNADIKINHLCIKLPADPFGEKLAA